MAVGMQTVYENFDGPYYLVIAKCLYQPECIAANFSIPLPLEYYPAHFPLYPLAIRLAGSLGLNSLHAMVAISLVAGAAAAVLLYKMAKEFDWGPPLALGLAWLFVWPRMWAVRSVGSPETLLMALVLASIYGFMKKRYWLAGIFGAGAVLAKPPGILLLAGYGLWWLAEGIGHKRWHWQAWPVSLMGLALVGVFGWYQIQTGDFFAYFHSGDNIHLQAIPFRVFDSSQPWVGTFWLEDILWIYLVGGVGVWRSIKKAPALGWFGVAVYATLMFVSHRDIARYSLPIVPAVAVGLSEIWDRREVRWVAAAMVVPMFFYTVNFLMRNTVGIPTWQPFL